MPKYYLWGFEEWAALAMYPRNRSFTSDVVMSDLRFGPSRFVAVKILRALELNERFRSEAEAADGFSQNKATFFRTRGPKISF